MSQTKLRILFIAHSPVVYTGSIKSLLVLLKELKNKGIDIFVVMPPKKKSEMSFYSELLRLGIECEVVRFYMPLWPSFVSIKDKIFFLYRLFKIVANNFFAVQKLKLIIKNRKINLIHTNVGPLLLGHKLSKITKTPHVWHVREFQDLDFSMNPFYSKVEFIEMLKYSNNYPIAISQAIFKYFEMEAPAQIIYNGIMHKSEKQYFAEKENYFLYVGYLRKEKGIEDLLEVYYEFSKVNSKIDLKIAGHTGDFEYLNMLKNYVCEKGISDRVRFLGNIDDVSTIMAKATALIVPSFYEAFGRVTVEAMFNGCLVIGKNTGGTKEIIEKVGVGILYETNEVLLNAMLRVAENGIQYYDDELRYAIEQAVSHFSIEENATLVQKLYCNILNDQKIG